MVLSRGVHPDTVAALSSGATIYPVVLVYLDWPGGAVRAHSNVGTISWGGEDWVGIGSFGAIRSPEETSGTARAAAVLELIGAPGDLDPIFDANIRGRSAAVYFGTVTTRSGNVLIGDPWRTFGGYMDALREEITDEAGSIVRVVSLTVASGPSQRLVTNIYHTPESQAREFPSDTAGRHVLNAEARANRMTWPA